MTPCSSKIVEDGRPEREDLLEGGLDHLLGRRGERVPGLPDGRAHEAVDDVTAHIAGGPGSGLHLFDGPFAQGLGLSFDGVGGEAVEAGIVLVADALAGEMGAEGPALEAVFLEDALLLADVGGVGRGLADVHVVAPAGDLQAVVAPAFGFLADLFERQVGPLAGEQRYGSCHDSSLFNPVSARSRPWPSSRRTSRCSGRRGRRRRRWGSRDRRSPGAGPRSFFDRAVMKVE